jgi:AraC-like DNA-binding protein
MTQLQYFSFETEIPFMQPVFFEPNPSLKDLVNHIMVFQTVFNEYSPAPSILLPPLPEQCIFFYPQDEVEAEYLSANKQMKLYTCSLVGPQTSSVKLNLGHKHLVIKISFQPGGLYRLLGIPMQELLQVEAFNGQDFLGKMVRELSTSIQETANLISMVHQIEMALMKRMDQLKPKLPIDLVLQEMVNKGGLLSIDKAASNAFLSNRQFERQFKQRIGLSPKIFSRLIRFSNAWIIKENNAQMKWTDIAHRSGYFDQMHLIRDFKEFAGINPKQIETEFKKMPFNPKNRVHL